MQELIYVIGHKCPDLDSVAAAIGYSDLRNKLENTNIYTPAIPGDVNRETQYILDKFKINKPALLLDASGKNIIQVDHNEFSQAVSGIDKAQIIEVIDHHKIVFNYHSPIPFLVKPWGAVSSVIFYEFKKSGIAVDPGIAGLMLSAIIVDTVISKSPTCTQNDIDAMNELSAVAGVSDWREFGMEIFKVRSSVSELTDKEVVRSDFKDFLLSSEKFGIGQVETVDLESFNDRQEGLLRELDKIKKESGYHTVVLFVTDILKEGSLFLVSTNDESKTNKALGAKLENGRVYIDGIISRKKQVAPKFIEVYGS